MWISRKLFETLPVVLTNNSGLIHKVIHSIWALQDRPPDICEIRS